MKKLIISLLIVGSLATTSIFAYDYNVKLNTEEYKSMLNTYLAEMTAEMEATQQKATLGTILFNGGIEEGYIKPSINNDTNLKNCISGLVDNIKDTKIIDKRLQEKHNNLMASMSELIILLDNSIECKKEILNSKESKLNKAQLIIFEDEKRMKEVNKKIEEVNNIYYSIDNFNKNNN